jgi:isopentenyldiphosphate isomerase
MDLKIEELSIIIEGIKTKPINNRILAYVDNSLIGSEQFAIFDENDDPITIDNKELLMLRPECHNNLNPPNFYHRGVNILLVKDNYLYVPIRATDKDLYPNCADVSVGEHVKVGESYEEAAIRGLKEELDLDYSKSHLDFLQKRRVDEPLNKEWVKYFVVIYKGDSISLSSETKSGSWYPFSELKDIDFFTGLNFRPDQKEIVYEFVKKS